MLATYAAVLSTITAAIQIINFYRDRRRIKLSVKHETEHFEVDGYEGQGETVTIVVVANAGRRPVTITAVGARCLFPRRGFVSFECNPSIPAELTEGKQLTALADEELVDVSEVAAWEAHDAIGRSYRMNVAPWHTRLRSRLRQRRAKSARKNSN